jgi:protein-tyrosine-phosphatase
MLPGAVLFACGINRVRSPMAEGVMKRLYGQTIFADSCGLRRDPQSEPDPFVMAVMDEIGVDLSHHHPKTFDDIEDGSFDLIISLTPEAHHRAGEMARGRAMEVEYWPTFDPTLASGSRDQVLEAYRAVRNDLAARIKSRFPQAKAIGG